MDISQSNWNETDDNNSTAAPDGAPEGMPPSGVNNTMRAMMGAIKRWYDQYIPATTVGTSTAYTLSYSVTPTGLVDGMRFTVKFHATCGAAPTLNVNVLGAKSIFKWYQGAWVALAANDIIAGQKLLLTYDQTSGNFQVLTPINVVQFNTDGTVPNAMPTGATMGFRGATSQVPAGWVLERGNSIGDASSGATERANADTVNLFTLLWANTNYGLQNSSGSTVSRGANAAADYAAHCRLVLPNMTNTFRRGDNSGTAVGVSGGADTHTHTVTAAGSGVTFTENQFTSPAGSGGINVAAQGHTHNFSVNVSGTAASGNNVPAYVTELSIIKL